MRRGGAVIGMRAALVLVVLAHALAGPRAVAAATWTVNPACATNGDGTAATCATTGLGPGAWRGLGNVTCGAGGIQPGDTLELKGATYPAWTIPATCDGTAGSRITVQNVAGEAVVFDGTTDIKGSAWMAVGGGVYQCTSGTCGSGIGADGWPWRAWYQRGGGAEEALTLQQAVRTCDATLGAGYMRYDTSAGAGGKVCVHLSDGSSPAAATYFRIPTSGSGIQLWTNAGGYTTATYLTLRVHPGGGSFTVRRFRASGIARLNSSKGITIDGLTIAGVNNRCIDTANVTGVVETDGLVIRNTTVADCGQEGIRTDTESGALVENNTVYGVQSYPMFDVCAGVGAGCMPNFTDNGTPIRLARTSGSVIRGNVVRDSGGGLDRRVYGIDLENGGAGLIIERNYVYNMQTGAVDANRTGRAIMISDVGGNDYAGAVIRNNLLWRNDVGIQFQAGSSNTTTGPISLYFNTIAESLYQAISFNSGGAGTWTGAVQGSNNLVVNLTTTPAGGPLLEIPASMTGAAIPTYGAYYCPNPTCAIASTLVRWKGASYKRAGDCSPGLNCIADFEVHSQYGDPNVDTSGSPPTLALTACGGSACDHGVAVSGIPLDFAFKARDASPDIGADEYDASVAPTPTATSTVTPTPTPTPTYQAPTPTPLRQNIAVCAGCALSGGNL